MYILLLMINLSVLCSLITVEYIHWLLNIQSLNYFSFITARGKVMFSQAFVIPSVHTGVGACIGGYVSYWNAYLF